MICHYVALFHRFEKGWFEHSEVFDYEYPIYPSLTVMQAFCGWLPKSTDNVLAKDCDRLIAKYDFSVTKASFRLGLTVTMQRPSGMPISRYKVGDTELKWQGQFLQPKSNPPECCWAHRGVIYIDGATCACKVSRFQTVYAIDSRSCMGHRQNTALYLCPVFISITRVILVYQLKYLVMWIIL